MNYAIDTLMIALAVFVPLSGYLAARLQQEKAKNAKLTGAA
jgi:hypothetical protein